jgi:hypothetical protein
MGHLCVVLGSARQLDRHGDDVQSRCRRIRSPPLAVHLLPIGSPDSFDRDSPLCPHSKRRTTTERCDCRYPTMSTVEGTPGAHGPGRIGSDVLILAEHDVVLTRGRSCQS